jgi:hypothetical protein
MLLAHSLSKKIKKKSKPVVNFEKNEKKLETVKKGNNEQQKITSSTANDDNNHLKASEKKMFPLFKKQEKSKNDFSDLAPLKNVVDARVVSETHRRGRKRTKTESENREDALNESDSSSDDDDAVNRLGKFRMDVQNRQTETLSEKRARKAGLDIAPGNYYNAELDGDRVKSEQNADTVMQEETQESKAWSNNTQSVEHLAQIAPLNSVSSIFQRVREEIGVEEGNALRVLVKKSIETVQERNKRLADSSDFKEIVRTMQELLKSEAAILKKSKWHDQLSDDAFFELVSEETRMAAKRLKNRIESRSAEQCAERNAALAVMHDAVSAKKDPYTKDTVKDADNAVDLREVRVSSAGRAEATLATVPAPGTLQREQIEADLKTLKDDEVLVTEHAKLAKMATCVPPESLVQGRELQKSAGTALLYGDGSTFRTATDFAVEKVLHKSVAKEELTQKVFDNLANSLMVAVKTFYDGVNVTTTEESRARTDASEPEIFRRRVIERVDEWADPGSKINTELRVFIDELLVGMPFSERREALRQKLNCIDTSAREERVDALVDAVLKDTADGGASKVPSTLNQDVERSVFTAASEWQREKLAEECERLVPTLSNEEIVEALDSQAPANEKILLDAVREYTPDLSNVASSHAYPVTLAREFDTIYEGHNKNIVENAGELLKKNFDFNSYFDVLRRDQTRLLNQANIRMRRLNELPRKLTAAEAEEMATLKEAVEKAEAVLAAKQSQDVARKYGHQHAAVTLEALYERASVDLEELPRSYIQPYLCEPVGAQRPCRNDEKCVGVVMGTRFAYDEATSSTNKGFTLRELLLPTQEAAVSQEGDTALPKARQYCFLCHVYQTNNIFMQLAHGKGEISQVSMCLQPFKTVHGEPGEYGDDDKMLSVSLNSRALGIIAPFPVWNPKYYAYGITTLHVEAPESDAAATKMQGAGDDSREATPFERARAAGKAFLEPISTKVRIARRVRCIKELDDLLFH